MPYEDFEAIDHDPNSVPFEDAESDPAVETRNLEREFAGTNLTPEQFEQVRQVRRQFRAEMVEAAQTRFPQLLLMMLLPQERAERLAGNIFGDAIANYGEGVAEIFTPEQLTTRQQNMEEYVQSSQQ
ncbi:MAG: hypothetical protein ACFB8W_22865 [Elainellaceae cyanobacterium]